MKVPQHRQLRSVYRSRLVPRRRAGVVLLAALGWLVTACGGTAAKPVVAWESPAGAASESASSPAAAPATPSPSPSTPSPTASPTTARPPAAGSGRYVYPVNGHSSYARTHHDYPASDIMAACGLPVRAVTDGVIAEVSRVDRFDSANPRGQDKGGLFVSLLGDDGVRYYGAHLSAVLPGIEAGARVAAGAQLGLVGSTGNSGACHLHFGISPPCQRTGDWWTRRGAVWPWSYLDAWRAGQGRSPAAEVAGWQAANGCPTGAA